MAETERGGNTAPLPEGATAITEEVVLNAAMAFAGHVATAAQQGVEQIAAAAPAQVRDALTRQYLLETATLCLRRLGESYETAAADPGLAANAELLRDALRRVGEARAAVEPLGDVELDLLDSLLEA
ncbi:MAG TPA: hypothetical protein VGW38_13215 [Chloroflexota bacterium]|nr:hypothetical protein [Chloroflexota bacterium]